jgi:hypothetical protein
MDVHEYGMMIPLQSFLFPKLDAAFLSLSFDEAWVFRDKTEFRVFFSLLLLVYTTLLSFLLQYEKLKIITNYHFLIFTLDPSCLVHVTVRLLNALVLGEYLNEKNGKITCVFCSRNPVFSDVNSSN